MNTTIAKLHITTVRSLRLIEFMIEKGMANSRREALDVIGFNSTNTNKLETGHVKLGLDHIIALCEKTGASADYVFGLSSNMLRKPAKDPFEMLDDAVRAIKAGSSK